MAFQVKNSDLQKAIQVMKSRVEDAVIMRLQRIGEQFINNARQNGNYTDRTGNLRSSIGYVILKNGLQLSGSNWIQVQDGGPGIIAGQKLLEEMAQRFPTGLVLIGVAGMDYAAAVESKGFDVITSSAETARQDLAQAIKTISQKLQS